MDKKKSIKVAGGSLVLAAVLAGGYFLQSQQGEKSPTKNVVIAKIDSDHECARLCGEIQPGSKYSYEATSMQCECNGEVVRTYEK